MGWDEFNKAGVIGKDEVLLEMLQDVRKARELLYKINGPYFMMARDSLSRIEQSLDSAASFRGIKYVERKK